MTIKLKFYKKIPTIFFINRSGIAPNVSKTRLFFVAKFKNKNFKITLKKNYRV